MKKLSPGILVLITCIFVAFTAGFMTGRNLNRTPVRISQAPVQATAAPSEAASETFPASQAPTTPAIVNINTATAAQLETLPGIGPVLAGRIVEYRAENGDFEAPEELIKVKGIGEAKLEAILDLITVGG